MSSQNFSAKIPEYAKEYKREYQYIRGINIAMSFIVDIMQENGFDITKEVDSHIFSNKYDILIKYIKRFLRATENGKINDISNFEFRYNDIDNIYEIKFSIYYYLSFIKNCYDWKRGLNDKVLESRYDRYKHILELFLGQINLKLQDTDYSDSE